MSEESHGIFIFMFFMNPDPHIGYYYSFIVINTN